MNKYIIIYKYNDNLHIKIIIHYIKVLKFID